MTARASAQFSSLSALPLHPPLMAWLISLKLASAPAVLPAVAAGLVAVAVTAGVDEIGDPLGPAVIALRERVVREPRGPGRAQRLPGIVQVLLGAAEVRRFVGELRDEGGDSVRGVDLELLHAFVEEVD